MMLFIILGLCAFGFTLLAFIHHRSKHVQQSKLIATLGNTVALLSLVIALYLVMIPVKNTPESAESYITVTCKAQPSNTPEVDEQKRRWLTKEAAEVSCRNKLAVAIKAELNIDVKRSGGVLTAKDIELKTNVALQLSEIVDGKFLPDGSYEMKMKAPRPVV